MPSLRKRVSSYLRQLSFHNEPRDKHINFIENTFIIKYLQGEIVVKEGPPIHNGKVPTDLPSFELGVYKTGPETIVGCFSGPDGGLTAVKRKEKHLSLGENDIDFIDTQDEQTGENVTTSQSIRSRSHANLPPEWNRQSDFVYGISDSLYDKNLSTKVKNGNPIADCFGIITRNDSAILAVADGVNWGEKAAIAAKSAVHGCLHYLNKTIFLDTRPFDNLINKTSESGESKETPIHEFRTSSSKDIFVCLLRAFNCAHDLILENNGMLTTLTVAIVLPLKDPGKHGASHVVCVCNVGDSLAYVYSQSHGIRELTKGSHDITLNRDMRDALGALGPVDGIKPELSNLTLSVTTLQTGDIVMVASDGLTDNFDPTVCKFAVNSEVASKRKPSGSGTTAPTGSSTTTASTSGTSSTGATIPQKPPRKNSKRQGTPPNINTASTLTTKTLPLTKPKTKPKHEEVDNPLVAQFLKDNPIQKSSSSSNAGIPPANKTLTQSQSQTQGQKGFALLRSKTALDFRSSSHKLIPRNPDGLPYITPVQKYEITLLMIEDILKKGISGKEHCTVTAKKLCENLLSFTMSITAAKRRTLEDNDLYFNNQNGVLVEASNQEKKMRRKRALEKVQNLPGKLDHVTVVACNVGNRCYSNV
ncbi:PP2C-like domain-containing protein CG9801 isoform X2 [Atheta coriaria]|uniref:PP2C-like domain-containing protein CG9801 isoform X2 n=1 Tax=Dalotia coriaria TaxID=877792 RepID=UPI0031F39BB5